MPLQICKTSQLDNYQKKRNKITLLLNKRVLFHTLTVNYWSIFYKLIIFLRKFGMTSVKKPENNSINKFLAHCHRRRYPAKSTIIYAGDKADVLYYIVKGSVSVLVEGESDQKEMIIAYLNAGEFFGEMGLFERGIRSAWIIAKTDCEISEITYSKFTTLYNDNPDFLFAITQQMASRLRETTQKASDLAFLDVTGRVASALIDLAKQPDAMSHPDGMQIKITRQEIGRIVVCSREMVGRVLKDLESRGLISVSGKTIVVYGTR